MAGFADLWSTITNRIIESPRDMPSTVTIPHDHVEQAGYVSESFKADEHYFQVLINEMYLTADRSWFSAIDPLVFVVSEFTYNKQPQIMPFLVGPALMQQYGGERLPHGMIFRDTGVTRLHPYRGGGLTLSVVLCQAEVGNYAKPLLQIIETAAKALDFSPALSPYVKVANVVLDGFQALVGSTGTLPLIGLRHSFSPNAGIPFTPRFFALIDAPDVDPQTLWVRERRLFKGSSPATAQPYRDADYVLYSVVKPPDNQRDDITELPFYSLWERVANEAAIPKQENYDNAKVNMATLYQSIVLSPDLTQPQADALADEYAARMQTLHRNAVRHASLGEERTLEIPDRLDDVRSKALAILKA